MEHVFYLIAYVALVLVVVLGFGLLLHRIRARRGVGWSVLRTFLHLIEAIVSAFPF